jgi:hypothetical protein
MQISNWEIVRREGVKGDLTAKLPRAQRKTRGQGEKKFLKNGTVQIFEVPGSLRVEFDFKGHGAYSTASGHSVHGYPAT